MGRNDGADAHAIDVHVGDDRLAVGFPADVLRELFIGEIDPDHQELREDPWVVEKVRGALATWERVLTPAEVSLVGELIVEMMANDVDLSALVRALRPRPDRLT